MCFERQISTGHTQDQTGKRTPPRRLVSENQRGFTRSGEYVKYCTPVDCITHPAGPATKTARVLETRPGDAAENVFSLSPGPLVDCWSSDGDGTLSAVLTAWCKEVVAEPSLDTVSLWSSAPQPLPEPVYWEPDDVKT